MIESTKVVYRSCLEQTSQTRPFAMSIQVWSIGLQKLAKMIENHVHISSTDHFKHVWVHGKMTEMKSTV